MTTSPTGYEVTVSLVGGEGEGGGGTLMPWNS